MFHTKVFHSLYFCMGSYFSIVHYLDIHSSVWCALEVFFFPFCNLGIENKAKKIFLNLSSGEQLCSFLTATCEDLSCWVMKMLGNFYHSRGFLLVFTVVLVCIFLRRVRLNIFPIFLSAICIVSYQIISQAFCSF